MKMGRKDVHDNLVTSQFPKPIGEFKRDIFLIETYLKKTKRNIKITYDKIVSSKKKKMDATK